MPGIKKNLLSQVFAGLAIMSEIPLVVVDLASERTAELAGKNLELRDLPPPNGRRTSIERQGNPVSPRPAP